MPERDFGLALIDQWRVRVIEESMPRIKKCLALLSDDEIWHRPNAETVSIGNLMLHMSGSMRQWICAGLGGQEDIRERSKEFSETGPLPKQQLLDRLQATTRDADAVLEAIDPTTLIETHGVQAYVESGVSIIVHQIEHVTYHTGQITYYTKSIKAIDLGYYAGENLESHGGPGE
jgi:uncharacterized damage-inducible protein DinB